MDRKWNDKWAIMVRKWMKDMSISDEKMDNSRAQHSRLLEYFTYGLDYVDDIFIPSVYLSICHNGVDNL